jgi:hypothetical protein
MFFSATCFVALSAATAQEPLPTATAGGRSDGDQLKVFAVTRFEETRPACADNLTDGFFARLAFRARSVLAPVAVATYPAEWLLLADIVRPLENNGYLPSGVLDFEPAGAARGSISALVEYADRQFPAPAGCSSAPRSPQLVPWAAFLDRGDVGCGGELWTRVVRAGADGTTATLFVQARARQRDTAAVGTLHAVQMFSLCRSSPPGTFRWRLDKTETDFVPDASPSLLGEKNNRAGPRVEKM